MKIMISDGDDAKATVLSGNGGAGQGKETTGLVAGEVAEGELTPPLDAGDEMDRSVSERGEEQDVWQRQHSGEVGVQTVDLKPSPGNPESGLPHNSGETESSSDGAAAAAEGEHANQKKSDLDSDARDALRSAEGVGSRSDTAGANTEETTRAATEHDEKFLRLAADFENYKRQVNRREAETRDRATRGVVEDLLPVLDNFERALESARTAKDIESLRVGIEFIAQQFRDALKNHGVEPIDAKGKTFDPLLHDALEEVGGSGAAEGTVVEETQRGYSYRGQVMRPSRVRVAGK